VDRHLTSDKVLQLTITGAGARGVPQTGLPNIIPTGTTCVVVDQPSSIRIPELPLQLPPLPVVVKQTSIILCT
jgi:hypothetical protein